jgi:hypothetical protein
VNSAEKCPNTEFMENIRDTECKKLGKLGVGLKMKREAGQVVPPPLFPLSGNPASLTEGD